MTTTTYTDEDLMARMKVKVPERERGNWKVERFTITEEELASSPEAWNHAMQGRPVEPGEYTRLTGPSEHWDGQIVTWMSDTTHERLDHLPAMQRIADPSCKSVLIGGLGLGLILEGALSFDHVERIDVVECQSEVVRLVGSHYAPLQHKTVGNLTRSHDGRVFLHHNDAYSNSWADPYGGWDGKEPWWDVAWHDIWPSFATENVALMDKLEARYVGKVGWQHCWGRGICENMLKIEKLIAELIELDHRDPERDRQIRYELGGFDHCYGNDNLELLVALGFVELRGKDSTE